MIQYVRLTEENAHSITCIYKTATDSDPFCSTSDSVGVLSENEYQITYGRKLNIRYRQGVPAILKVRATPSDPVSRIIFVSCIILIFRLEREKSHLLTKRLLCCSFYFYYFI